MILARQKAQKIGSEGQVWGRKQDWNSEGSSISIVPRWVVSNPSCSENRKKSSTTTFISSSLWMGLTRHKFLDLAHSTAALTMDLDWNLKIGV